jgi:hypothetical protein
MRWNSAVCPCVWVSELRIRGAVRLEGHMVMAVALLVSSMIASAADVTGKWEGKITGQREDGSTSEDTALLILEQKGTAISGTVGGNEEDQHPITSGRIEGNKITIAAKNANNGREYQLELTLDGDGMSGTLVSGNRKGQIAVKKRKG